MYALSSVFSAADSQHRTGKPTMRELSKKKKIISCTLKSLVILSAVTGTILSAFTDRNGFMGGSRVFMYFTIQSNLAIALICAMECILPIRAKKVRHVMAVIKFMGTVAITLTGVVFVVMLAPTLGARAWNIHNVLTHVIVPAAAIADFFLTGAGTGLKKRNVFFVLLPPFLYVIYAGIGYIRGWEFSKGNRYPYFFLNWGSPAGAFGFTDRLPYMGCVWWILLLLVFLIFVGLGYLTIANRPKKGPAGREG